MKIQEYKVEQQSGPKAEEIASAKGPVHDRLRHFGSTVVWVSEQSTHLIFFKQPSRWWVKLLALVASVGAGLFKGVFAVKHSHSSISRVTLLRLTSMTVSYH